MKMTVTYTYQANVIEVFCILYDPLRGMIPTAMPNPLTVKIDVNMGMKKNQHIS